jgi:stress response protein SCP2
MLDNAGDDYWQNTDYRNCEEINLAGKNITGSGAADQEYQILDSN